MFLRIAFFLTVTMPAAYSAPTKATIHYVQSCSADALSPACVHDALVLDGAVAISDVPGLFSAREVALLELARCTTDEQVGFHRMRRISCMS
eukprot:2715396-Pleurochrysis_carterae.AAC.2